MWCVYGVVHMYTIHALLTYLRNISKLCQHFIVLCRDIHLICCGFSLPWRAAACGLVHCATSRGNALQLLASLSVHASLPPPFTPGPPITGCRPSHHTPYTLPAGGVVPSFLCAQGEPAATGGGVQRVRGHTPHVTTPIT